MPKLDNQFARREYSTVTWGRLHKSPLGIATLGSYPRDDSYGTLPRYTKTTQWTILATQWMRLVKLSKCMMKLGNTKAQDDPTHGGFGAVNAVKIALRNMLS